MDRQNKPPYVPSFNTRPVLGSKTSIPEKKVSDDMIGKLFLTVSEGNYLKIRDFLLNNQMSMGLKNENGESVLHIIIKNSNISKNDKLALVKLGIEKGAPISSFDKNNITPIHLACKYQLPKVVGLLIEKGANVRVQDSQYKTPLHYAIVGESTDCKDVEKVKPIIPRRTKGKVIKQSNNITDIQKYINDFMFADPETRKFVKQIQKSLSASADMFPFEITDRINKNKKDVVEILVAQDLNDDDKSKVIFERITSAKSSISNVINDKLEISLSPMSINTNTPNGWGPDNLEQNKILEIRSIMSIAKESEIITTNENRRSIIGLQASTGSLGRNIDGLQSYINECDKVIGYCLMYGSVIEILTGNPNFFQNVTDALFDGITYTDPIIMPQINKNLRFEADLDFDVNNDRLINNITNLLDSHIGTEIGLEIPDNPLRPRQDIKTIQNSGVRPRRLPLSIENPIAIGAAPVIAVANVIDPQRIGIIHPIHGAPNIVTIRNAKFFHTRMKFYIWNLSNEMTTIRGLVLAAENNIQNDRPGVVYSFDIPQIVIMCLNICTILNRIVPEIAVMHRHFTNLLHMFEGQTQLLESIANSPTFLTEQIGNDLKEIIRMTGNLNVRITTIYKSVTETFSALNGIISLLESLSAQKCINAYYAGDFDVFYTSQQTQMITNIINGPLQRIKQLPPSHLDLMKLTGDDIYLTKKILVEEYVPQIYSGNLVSTISANPAINPITGFLGDINNINGDGTPITEYLRDTVRGVQHDIVAKAPDAVLNGNDGNIGNILQNVRNKYDEMPPIIGKFLDTHLTMLKYAIIRWIIQKIHEMMTIPGPQRKTNDIIRTLINQISDSIENVVDIGQGKNGFIFTLVGRYVDKILINFIKGLITYEANKITLRSISEMGDLPEHYTTMFANIRRSVSESSTVASIDNGFVLNMNEIFEELISMYNKPKNILRPKILAMSVGDLNEEQDKLNPIQKLLNYNYEINSIEQTCYKIDYDVINTLIDNKADINARDNLGNGPIFYAIEMQNVKLIEFLTSKGALSLNKNSKNRMGKTPLEYAWDNYCDLVQTLMINKYQVCDSLTQNILDKLSKMNDHNNVPSYSKIIIPLTLYLLNHQIFIIGKGYPNKWTFEQNDRLEKLLNMNASSLLPMLQVTTTSKDFAKLDVPNVKSEQLEKELQDDSNIQKKIEDQLENFTKELNSLRMKVGVSNNETSRMNELVELIAQYTEELNIAKRKISRNKNILGNITQSKSSAYDKLKSYIASNEHRLKRSGNVGNVYESVFIHVLNHEYEDELTEGNYDYKVDTKTYPKIWKKYFSEIKNNDYTQIIDLISDYQKKIISSNDSVQNKVNSFNIIHEYYENVIVPFSRNYFELPKEYNPTTNYALAIVIDIITHIIKRIVFPIMFGLITKIITKYVIMMYPDTKGEVYESRYQTYIANLVTGIIDDKGNKGTSRLMKYVFDVLPLKIVKVILQIYEGDNEGEDDIDRGSTVESLLLYINKIILTTTVIDLTEESSLIVNLREHIYPFYVEYLTLFVNEMKILIDNYMRSLEYQSKSLKILKALSNKSVLEIS